MAPQAGDLLEVSPPCFVLSRGASVPSTVRGTDREGTDRELGVWTDVLMWLEKQVSLFPVTFVYWKGMSCSLSPLSQLLVQSFFSSSLICHLNLDATA